MTTKRRKKIRRVFLFLFSFFLSMTKNAIVSPYTHTVIVTVKNICSLLRSKNRNVLLFTLSSYAEEHFIFLLVDIVHVLNNLNTLYYEIYFKYACLIVHYKIENKKSFQKNVYFSVLSYHPC
jgi:hypothetical protein